MKTITLKRSMFPLTRFYINFGDGNNYSLRSGEIKNINIKKGVYKICVNSYWIVKEKTLTLNGGETIMVKHSIPDVFYIIGLPIVILSFFISFYEIFEIWYIGLVGFIFVLPIAWVTFFKTKNYFKIIKSL